MITQRYLDELTHSIFACAIEVHRHVGAGLLEKTYEKCFTHELSLRGIRYKTQQTVPLHYKGISFEEELRYDVLVEDLIVVELKSNEGILPIHRSIVLNYMSMLEKPKGIIINFNCSNIMKEGQKTLVNEIYRALPDQ